MKNKFLIILITILCFAFYISPVFADRGDISSPKPDCAIYPGLMKARVESDCRGTNPANCLRVNIDSQYICYLTKPTDGLCFERSDATDILCRYAQANGQCAGQCPPALSPSMREAAPVEDIKFEPTLPRLQIDIPGLQPFTKASLKTTEEGDTVMLDVNFIGPYLVGLYKYLVGISGIVAGIMIVWAGAVWLTSGGNPERISEAKKKIAGAVVGLILVLGSYIILQILNPELVIFKPLRVEYIKRVLLADGAESEESYDAEAATPEFCPGAEHLQTVPRTAVNLGLATDRDLLMPEASEKLLLAAQIAGERGYGLWVCSAARTIARQQKLWEEGLKKYGSEQAAQQYVARPRCGAPHLTGRAVDIVLFSKDLSQPVTGDGCTKTNLDGDNATQRTPEQHLLEDIMYTAGWRRYCGEWWHFEFGTPRTQRAGSNRCAT